MSEQNFRWLDAGDGHGVKAWIKGVPVDDQTLAQLRNTARMPFVFKHIAAMPDVHWGLGATVGSVIPTIGAIMPAAVGVDIGCGMYAVRSKWKASDLPDSLRSLRSRLEAAVPHGRTNHGQRGDRGAWGEAPRRVADAYASARDGKGSLASGLGQILRSHPKLKRLEEKAPRHLGTLGTGNHFLEVCIDGEQRVWVMLHSGSRGPGNAIGMHFINLARKEMERWFIKLADKDLAYLAGEHQACHDYLKAVMWAQRYAWTNRELMMRSALETLDEELTGKLTEAVLPEPGETAVHCHHNYIATEHHFGRNVWITRKGAVRARRGDLGIIPGSMGARSYIVRGKGNPDSFCSCSHGAGRALSRTEAKRRYSVADHEAATAGVECRKDEEVIDETPMAYKDIDAVMAAQSDLVEVLHELKQVVCVKG